MSEEVMPPLAMRKEGRVVSCWTSWVSARETCSASCVHCHQIGDALRVMAREKREPMPLRLIYSFPPPQAIGLARGQ
jgi:hypothetical protein